VDKDYYKILGVEKNASQDEIKKAFRKKAHQYHPDKPDGDEEKFKEANEAYQVLGDEGKRKKYDQFGSAAFEQGGFGSGGSGFGGFGGFESVDLGDIFGNMGDIFGFGGGSSRKKSQRGRDIQIDVELTFHDAVFGIERETSLTKTSSCERCGGVGAEPGSKMKDCAACGGSGSLTHQQRTIFGVIQTRRICNECGGDGSIPEKKCERCGGTGLENKKKTIKIRVPAGVDDGDVMRVRGEGESVKGGGAGDLFLRIHVQPSGEFTRDGNAIRSSVRIGFTQAALGAAIEVPTVDGEKVMLKIPAGTQSGTELRMRGKGVPTGSYRGDQLVTVTVVTPKKISREQKKLLEELRLEE
jgi:molecular chaperone DnaJ